MNDISTQSPAAKFAQQAFLQQSKLIREHSWMATITPSVPFHAQLS